MSWGFPEFPDNMPNVRSEEMLKEDPDSYSM